MTSLDEQECWHLLSMNALGRLATVVAGQPEIFPVNYHAQRPTILFRTAEGTKLFSTVVNDRVAFEIDDHVVDHGWSVVAKGRARVLDEEESLAAAQNSPVRSWVGTRKDHFVSIEVDEISGRRFVFGPEPGA
jgi:hypothetical protein